MVNRVKILFVIGMVLGAAGLAVGLDLAGSDGVEVSDGVPLSSPNNNTVVLNGNTNVSLENFAPTSDTVELITEDGNITVTSAGDTRVAVLNTAITGTQTELTDIIASGTFIEANPEDKNRIKFRGDLTELHWSQTFDLNNRVEDVFVNGPNGGTATIRYFDFPANTPIKAVDVNTNNVLANNQSTANGEATFDIGLSAHSVSFESYTTQPPSVSNLAPTGTIRFSPTLSADIDDANFADGETVDVVFRLNGSQVHSQTISSTQTVTTSVSGLSEGSHTFEVEATDSTGATTTQSVTFTVEHYEPTATNLSPTGDLDFEPNNLEADIADKDFAFDGDTLTVTIFLDGSQIDQQTINANQTVSTSIPQSGQMGGNHNYRFRVEDSYGNSINATASYAVPDTFTIRNELNHSEIIDDPINSTVTFYGSDATYQRFTTDGTINMTNLPVNQDFIVEIRPTDLNWTDRTVYVNSIYEQQSAYLLNTSVVPTIQSRFVLNDQSGQYDSESVLKIQRSINISGTQTWQTIHADEFGVEGVQTTLEEGVRHRIVVRDDDGNEQIVGPYRAEQSEQVQVEPGAASIDIGEFEDGIGHKESLNNRTVNWQFSSPNQEIDQLTVSIYEKNNKSNKLRADYTFFNIHNASDEFTITANESDKRWIVNYTYEIDGETFVITGEIGNSPQSFDALGSNWQAIIGVGLLVLLAGAFSVLNAAVGAVVISVLGGLLWWLGLFSGATSGFAIALALVVAAVTHMRTASGP